MSPDRLAVLETTVAPAALPPGASPWLRTLLEVHRRVISPRHRTRTGSPDGTLYRFVTGPEVRRRTQLRTPVPPPLEGNR